MNVTFLSLSFLVLFAATGCGSRRETASESPPASTGTAAPVQVGAAGEGMCSEHGVLEAVCTKCNPKLVPIFKSKGDWCAEHDFPESFCPICHPELGGRPSGDVAPDEAPADGMRVTFATKEVAEQVGLETTPALRGDEAGAIVATALLAADASKNAFVNVRFPGVIRRFQVDLGTVVAKGTPLAMIESGDIADGRARLQSALARSEAAEANYEREEALHEKGISALKDVQSAKQALVEANAEVAAASASVGMVGDSDDGAGVYALLAPIAGVVTARHFTVGTSVDREETIFQILDTTTLWAEIDVPESQANRVAVGQKVTLDVDGMPGRAFVGKIRYVAPLIDTSTRTIRARAAIDNSDGALRANMYALARIAVGSPGGTALVPRAAVQEAKGVKLVFVPVADDAYEARRVRVDPSDDALVAVTAGLRPGELVVTTGSFLLKTETLKESIGAGCCDAVAEK